MGRLSIKTALLAAAAGVVWVGCSGDDGPQMAKVNGVVLVGGQPARNFAVQFHPSVGPLSVGVTDADGRFVLTTKTPGDGAVVGQHQVALIYIDPNISLEVTGFEALKNSPIELKYAQPDAAGLTATVEPDIENSFRFDIPGKSKSAANR